LVNNFSYHPTFNLAMAHWSQPWSCRGPKLVGLSATRSSPVCINYSKDQTVLAKLQLV